MALAAGLTILFEKKKTKKKDGYYVLSAHTQTQARTDAHANIHTHTHSLVFARRVRLVAREFYWGSAGGGSTRSTRSTHPARSTRLAHADALSHPCCRHVTRRLGGPAAPLGGPILCLGPGRAPWSPSSPRGPGRGRRRRGRGRRQGGRQGGPPPRRRSTGRGKPTGRGPLLTSAHPSEGRRERHPGHHPGHALPGVPAPPPTSPRGPGPRRGRLRGRLQGRRWWLGSLGCTYAAETCKRSDNNCGVQCTTVVKILPRDCFFSFRVCGSAVWKASGAVGPLRGGLSITVPKPFWREVHTYERVRAVRGTYA